MRILSVIAGGLCALVLLIIASSISSLQTSAAQIEQRPSSQPNLPTWAQPAPAASPQEPEITAPNLGAIQAAWRNWMVRHDITQSTISIGQNGKILSTVDAGRSAELAYPVASLSKAVTAMCLNKLLPTTPYTWDTPLSELTPVWDNLNMAPHAELAKLPLSALVTHTSGLPRRIDPAKTGPQGRNFYTQINFARTALRDPTLLNPDRKHLYSNVGYGLLGQIIEGMTGQPYGDYCGTTIMAPAGATSAQIGGPMWATGGFGGWSITASDYARFIMYWYAADRPWVKTPQNYPLDRASGMGLSVYNYYDNGRHMFYHSGLWRSKKTIPPEWSTFSGQHYWHRFCRELAR